MSADALVSQFDVEAAAARLMGAVRRTPLVATDFLGDDPLLLKAECLQLSGSFKVRGALNAVALLPESERARGVITHSSGNHGQAVARAAAAYGVPATVVMPHSTPDVKKAATVAQGATVVFVEAADRAAKTAELQAASGAAFVPPFDHPDIIAGQGTVGLEIASDCPDARTVYVPVGGGGLISGVAVAVKALLPGVRVVGVEPELAGDLAAGRLEGRRLQWPADLTGRTIADGLRGQGVGEHNWRHIEALVDDVITVTEDQIVAALRRIVLEAKLVCEPSGAVAVAGCLADSSRASGPAVAVVSGGNVDPAWLAEALA